MDNNTRKHLSERYGIKPEEIEWYNFGICYDRIVVNTKEAATKVHDAVKGGTVNGGMLHGMPLGGIYEYVENGKTLYDVTC